MKITLVLKDSIFDCKIKITDSRGEQYHYLSPLYADENSNSVAVTVDVFDGEFSLSVIPMLADSNTILQDFEVNNWKDRLAKKATKFLLNSLDKMALRVGCDYKINGLKDGDRLDITMQSYIFGTFDRFDLLDLLPICYMFFEVSNFNLYYKLTDAYETNRKDMLKFAKKFALTQLFAEGIFAGIFTYPIQMGRAKRLTKPKKILKTLTKFNTFTEAEREAFLKKQEKFANK